MEIPSVIIYVRHAKDCPHRTQGEDFKNCQCRKHLRWWHQGRQFRRTAKTRSWGAAEKLGKSIEAKYAGDPVVATPGESGKTLDNAIRLFLADKQLQGLGPSVIGKYRREL